jgi:hypothetical protein
MLCFWWDLVKEMNSNAFHDLKTSWKICVAGVTVFSGLDPVTLHAPLDVFTNCWWRPVLGRLTAQQWYCIPLSRKLVSALVCRSNIHYMKSGYSFLSDKPVFIRSYLTNSVEPEPEGSSPYSQEPILSQLNPIYTPPASLPKIYSDPILLSTFVTENCNNASFSFATCRQVISRNFFIKKILCSNFG